MRQKTAFNQFLRTIKNYTYPNRIAKGMAKSLSPSEAQLGQDLFVLKQLNFKRGGFFVEIGTGDGKTISNTYLLEKRYGWRGILCEPNPLFEDSIRSARSATLDTRAVYRTSGEQLSFLCCGELSTLENFKDGDHFVRSGKKITVETVSLNQLLSEHKAVSPIDYISIDTEGSEIEILMPFDFERWQVSIFTVEHNYVPERLAKLDALLLPRRYRRVLPDKSAQDAWYVRQVRA